jgi:hypothetical protein
MASGPHENTLSADGLPFRRAARASTGLIRTDYQTLT